MATSKPPRKWLRLVPLQAMANQTPCQCHLEDARNPKGNYARYRATMTSGNGRSTLVVCEGCASNMRENILSQGAVLIEESV